MDSMDVDEQNLEGTARSTRQRCSARIANRDAKVQPRETVARPATALSTPPRTVRKRKFHTTSQPDCRSTRQYNARPSASDAALANSSDQAELHTDSEAVNDQRVSTSRLDQGAGSGPARVFRGASHRPDPMSTSLYSTPASPSSGAALAGAGEGEAPHSTSQREREAMSHRADEQSPPPSPLAASQRPFRPKLSRAKQKFKLHGASHRFGLLKYLQIFIHYLQCMGEQYSANGQRHVIYFHTDDMASTRDWKAISPALDTGINQPTISFTDGTSGGPTTQSSNEQILGSRTYSRN
jgi:hypothetical protein